MKILELDDDWENKLREYVKRHHTFQGKSAVLINEVCNLIIAYMILRIKGGLD